MSRWYFKNLQGNSFALKSSFLDHLFKVMIFDLQVIWSETLTTESFLERCKELNPMMEFTAASMESLIPTILGFLVTDNVAVDININLCGEQDLRLLKIETQMGGVPFKFAFKLSSPTTEFLLFNEVTTPLLTSIDSLLKRERFLVETIKKKDVEINEYKAQGVQISRKNVVTRPFEEDMVPKTELDDPLVTFTTATSMFPHTSLEQKK